MCSAANDNVFFPNGKVSEKMELESVDDEIIDVTEVIGGYGPWQRNLFIFLLLASIPSTWHNLMITFMAPPGIDFWCVSPTPQSADGENALELGNATKGNSMKCETVIHQGNTSRSVKCKAWEYNTTFYQSTIINEWNLVCDREWLISFSKSIYNVGYLVALLICGQLSDTFGRRPVLLLSYVVNVSAGILSAFSTSFSMFAVLRFLTAFGAAGFYTITFVFIIELVSPACRPGFGIAINFGWCLAFASLPGVAWLVRDWVWLQLALTLPKLLFLPVFWMVPESPRWLLIHNKTEKFREVVTKAAIKNGKAETWIHIELDKLLLNFDRVIENIGESSREASFLDLFRTPGLWKYTLNLFYNWLVNSFVYYGLSYNVDGLAGNIYLNFFASGAIEIPGYACAIYVTRRMGRRIPMTVGMCAAGLAFALTLTVPNKSSLFWLTVVLSLVGKFFVTATFSLIYVYTAEIFPTVVRSVGVGAGSAVSRIGSIAAPFLNEIDPTSNSMVTNTLYAVLSITSGVLVLFLPETNNIKCTDTLDEVEKLKRKKFPERSKGYGTKS